MYNVTSLSDYKLNTVKPFVKWAGGKGQLLNEIRAKYPVELGHSITKYAEPFVGGGAVLFDILSRYQLEILYISDINKELINTYKIIRNNVSPLLKKLHKLQDEYCSLNLEEREEYYYQNREIYNELKVNGCVSSNIEKAALFIFLNKTCFNGLYRVNRKGLFNVPAGAYKNPLICDEANLIAISEKLKDVVIICGDYRDSASFIDGNTFVYFDPPYRPITATASFTAYTENLFNDDSQRELAEFVELMSERKANVLVSNSDPKNSDTDDDFFDVLYSTQNISRVEATRMINCNSELRGKVSELLICNF